MKIDISEITEIKKADLTSSRPNKYAKLLSNKPTLVNGKVVLYLEASLVDAFGGAKGVERFLKTTVESVRTLKSSERPSSKILRAPAS